MMGRRSTAARMGAVAVLASGQLVAAPRPLFEPTDLELEEPGMVQLDTQVGELRGQDASRAVVPDVEVDIGLTRNVEVDIDAQYAIEGPGARGFQLNRPEPDNLWVASKMGLWDARDPLRNRAWALGLQLGPKIPMAPQAKGAGFEGLVLLGRRIGQSHIAINLGAVLDPGQQVSRGRTSGLEGGVDVSIPVDKQAVWTVLGEVGGVRFLSNDRHQLHCTAGISWAAGK